MDHHPNIVFRSGPAGHRPALVGNLDVWEVVQIVQNVEFHGDSGMEEAANWLGLSAAEVRTAMEYYASYPTEIDAWLAKITAQAVEAEDLFLRRQEMLG